MRNTITFQLNESICSRLALYAAQHGLPSWEAAIEDMLAKCGGNTGSAPAPAANPAAIQPSSAQPYLSQPEIVYHPAGEDECKRALIAAKFATVRIHYANGEARDKPWHITKLREHSYLRGNIKTGPLRNWRDKGIVKAEVFAGGIK